MWWLKKNEACKVEARGRSTSRVTLSLVRTYASTGRRMPRYDSIFNKNPPVNTLKSPWLTFLTVSRHNGSAIDPVPRLYLTHNSYVVRDLACRTNKRVSLGLTCSKRCVWFLWESSRYLNDLYPYSVANPFQEFKIANDQVLRQWSITQPLGHPLTCQDHRTLPKYPYPKRITQDDCLSSGQFGSTDEVGQKMVELCASLVNIGDSHQVSPNMTRLARTGLGLSQL